jgi:hypothetical protein
MDLLRGLPVTVVPEKDLSEKRQELDLLIIRTETGVLNCRLPDGFEDLTRYTLVTFKSHQDKLSVWTLLELIGHYVNVRKQVSPSMDEDQLLAEEEFRLYAVCVRYPQQLASQVPLERVVEGVYEVQVLTSRIRIVVVNQLPRQENNAMLHLFSTQAELLSYGVEHYRIHSGETSTLLLQLYERYREEEVIVPNPLEEFTRETIDRLLQELPAEKRREGLTIKECLQLLRSQPAGKPLAGLSAEERQRLLEGIPLEKRLEGLTPEERLKGLSDEEIERVLQERKAQRSSRPSKPRRGK